MTIYRTGLGLFIAGLIFMLTLLFMANYKLTEDGLKNALNNEKHYEQLRPVLTPMIGKTYKSSFSFTADFKNIFNELNDKYKAEKQWDKVIWNSSAIMSVTKNSNTGFVKKHQKLSFLLSFVLILIGSLMYILPQSKDTLPGIKNDNIFHAGISSKGWLGILLGTFLIGFYITLYWYPEYLTSWVLLVDPVSMVLSGNAAGHWFLYGFIYTIAISVMGIRMIIKYRHSNYQIVRTLSVMFFQISFAFIIPEILVKLNQPYYDFKNMWPLDYDFFDAWHINMLTHGGGLGIFMFAWGITLFVIGVPLFVYLFGKRWYCSWVCGCGGLAETLGDPFRQLSNKSLKAWKVERILIHGVLVFSILMTVGVLYTFFSGAQNLLTFSTDNIRQSYGFLIGSVFAGVVGTGFYPLMGNRVWCRFGCPLAAYLGMVQRFKSRFRITTNGGQCISCGNCSTYCEMGIDVRWYAQRGENIVRSSCVGCGVCSEVCPRGVLKLETGPLAGRTNSIDLDKLVYSDN